jgi:integrase/recombinase XerD
MTANATTARRPSGQALKSPLAAHSYGASGGRIPLVAASAAQGTPAELSPRAITLADYADHLRTTNNRKGRPYEETTVENYVYAGRALDAWMTAQGIEGDFTVCDTVMLNRFLRGYFTEHGQGGTHSQQRNMRHLFTYLQREHGHPHPYTEQLHHYQERKGQRPATLSGDFIKDLLEVTGGGRARDFANARDHAIIRVVPLKGARTSGEGRLVWLTPSTARALSIYLRVRRGHRHASCDWVWLGRGRFGKTGIRMMLERRAAEAGYGRVTPHQFRHTFSHDWLESGGSEGDLMRINGWKTRAMIDRYTDDLAEERALQAKKRRGDMY